MNDKPTTPDSIPLRIIFALFDGAQYSYLLPPDLADDLQPPNDLSGIVYRFDETAVAQTPVAPLVDRLMQTTLGQMLVIGHGSVVGVRIVPTILNLDLPADQWDRTPPSTPAE
jgi:hypothetical protein